MQRGTTVRHRSINEASMSGEPLKFLIADDHPMVRDALASALAQAFAGAAIAMAGSLVQVQGALDREPETDALLLDLDMPGMDGLTGLGNRGYFDAALEKAVAECHAENAPLALLLADLDHFKSINDTYGHVVGDRVLRFVATTLKQSIKGKDVIARYGGEEFAVILPRTPLRAAIEVAEQLRLAVMKGELIRRSTGEKYTRVTISIVVAALHNRTSPQALLEAADVCLHAAKRSGRNCVVGEKDERLLSATAG